MTIATPPSTDPDPLADRPGPASTPASARRRLRGAAALRITFGLVWALDAAFKWMPGFIDGRTLEDELGRAPEVDVPVVHGWLQVWNEVGLADPSLFAHAVAVVETVVAVLLILGLLSRAALVGSAVLAFGIWTGAEGMHLPWFTPGQTDVGPSVGYVFASLGLLCADAGRTWSVDAVLARRTALTSR